MFVHDFSHRCLCPVEDVRHEEEEHEEHGTLIGQRERSVLGLRVGRHLLVDVVVLDGQDDRLDNIR